MKAVFYSISLLLSLPNLLIGLALVIVRHTFATWDPLEMITSFLFQIVWGLPLAAALVILLLVLGILSLTRPYAAMFVLVLNIAALGLVLIRIGPPRDLDQGIFFIPVALALVGFGWLSIPMFRRAA